MPRIAIQIPESCFICPSESFWGNQLLYCECDQLQWLLQDTADFCNYSTVQYAVVYSMYVGKTTALQYSYYVQTLVVCYLSPTSKRNQSGILDFISLNVHTHYAWLCYFNVHLNSGPVNSGLQVRFRWLFWKQGTDRQTPNKHQKGGSIYSVRTINRTLIDHIDQIFHCSDTIIFLYKQKRVN